MPITNSKFSQFEDGGDLEDGDIVVGLRDGINTRFLFSGVLPPGTVVPISQGGTGATTAAVARTNLGLGDLAVLNSPLPLANGGTSAVLVASLGGIFYSTGSAGAILAGTATARQMLQSGAAAAPAWSTATYPATTTINQLLFSSAANTITGLATANGGVLVTNSTGVPSLLANPGASGRFLVSVSGDASAWSTATFPAAAGATGTILRSDGTNWVATTATYPNTTTINQLLFSSAANTIGGLTTALSAALVTNVTGVPVFTGTATDGQVLIGATGGTPAFASITAGTNITLTPSANGLTISASGGGGGYAWTEVTGTSQSMAANTGYVLNNAALVTATLPVTATLGQSVILQGKGKGLYRIAQNSGQTIHFGNVDTTTGTGGSLTATNRYDSIELLCITANTDWAVISGSQGIFTVV